jgi:hypothetical protein
MMIGVISETSISFNLPNFYTSFVRGATDKYTGMSIGNFTDAKEL